MPNSKILELYKLLQGPATFEGLDILHPNKGRCILLETSSSSAHVAPALLGYLSECKETEWRKALG